MGSLRKRNISMMVLKRRLIKGSLLLPVRTSRGSILVPVDSRSPVPCRQVGDKLILHSEAPGRVL